MHSDPTPADEQIRLAREYFARVDAGDPGLLAMFTDDAQAYFPKLGTARSKAEIVRLVQALTSAVPRFVHDPDRMTFTQAGNRLVVEGVEAGVLADGTSWPAAARSEGRYCNVFEFRGPLISRLHIHVDPDFAGRHDDMFASR